MNYIKILVYMALIGCLNTFEAMHLIYDNDGYKVVTKERCVKVNAHDMSPLLQKMDHTKLKQFLNNGGRIRAHKLSNGDFFLRDHIPGPGGCPSHGVLSLFCVAIVGSFAVVGITALASPEMGLICYCIGLSAFSTFSLFESVANQYNPRDDLLLPL